MMEGRREEGRGREHGADDGHGALLESRAWSPTCPHLLVDVNGLLILLQLCSVTGHLQQTLVG